MMVKKNHRVFGNDYDCKGGKKGGYGYSMNGKGGRKCGFGDDEDCKGRKGRLWRRCHGMMMTVMMTTVAVAREEVMETMMTNKKGGCGDDKYGKW